MTGPRLAQDATTAPSIRPARSWRLAVPVRKAVLVLHLASAVGWLGMDLVLGIFVLSGVLSPSRNSAAVSYQAIQIFAVWALLPAGLTCLATGLVLGLSSKYGVLRFRWVTVKLLINIGLTALVPVAPRPAAANAAEYGRQLAAGQLPATPRRSSTRRSCHRSRCSSRSCSRCTNHGDQPAGPPPQRGACRTGYLNSWISW